MHGNVRNSGVSPVIAVVLLVTITVVLAAVVYYMAMGMVPSTAGNTAPMGLTASRVNVTKIVVSIASAPLNAHINGTAVVLLNATTGTPAQVSNITVYDPGGNPIAYGVPINGSAVAFWKNGMSIHITTASGNYVSPGDTVQLTGTGFSASIATIK